MNTRKTSVYKDSIFTMIVLFVMILYSNCTDKSLTPELNDNSLEYIAPEEAGYSSTLLNDVKQFAEQSGYAAIMALYDGKVFFFLGEYYKKLQMPLHTETFPKLSLRDLCSSGYS